MNRVLGEQQPQVYSTYVYNFLVPILSAPPAAICENI